jgi:Uma2 family endonuclease
MSLEPSIEVLEAVEHLPNGATLVIHEFSWDDYERLLENLGDRPGLRISYDSGRLEVMSPTFRHEECEDLIGDLVLIFCEAFHLTLQKAGRTTWRRRSLAKGAEADGSFYIRNAKHTIGKEDIDLEQDPPPDIAVEVDVTRNSAGKFPIYAGLGIPEVWRYHREVCKFYALTNGKYKEIAASGFLPQLTGEMISDAIEIGRSKGQDEARRTFRRRIRTLKKK